MIRKKRNPPMMFVCTTRFDDGKCPEDCEYNKEVREERFADGWKTAII